MLLKIKELTKHYIIGKKDRFKALDKVNLEFEEGELVSILGESGSGKSTLMNIIGGLDSDYEGEVLVNGKDLKKLKAKALDKYRKNEIGFIFQSFNLISHLSILDNVAIALTISNVGRKKRIKKAKEMLTKVGLGDHLKKKPNQLSGGQKQRVAIARALINDPEIILADEPTGSLDSKTSEQILDIIKGISAEGKLIIMVTHSEKVAAISSRVIHISDGEIISDKKQGKTKKIVKTEETSVVRQNLGLFSAIKLALNNMKEKFFRNLLVSLGSSVGILSVVLMLSLGTGIETFIEDEITGFLDPTQIQVVIDEPNTEMVQTEMPEPLARFNDEQVGELAALDNVTHVNEAISLPMSATVTYEDESFQIIAFEAMNNLDLEDSSAYLHGEQPGTNEIVISTVLAENMMGEGNYMDAIGEEITVFIRDTDDGRPFIISRELTVSGLYDLEKFFDSGLISTFANVNMTMMDFDYLQTVYADEGHELSATAVVVNVDRMNNVESVREAINDAGFYIFDMDEIVSQLLSYLRIATVALAGIAGISLIVSGIMILIVLHISVVERTREIGVLRAIGARRKDIRRIFFVESALLGFFAGIIGVGLAYLIALGINAASNNQFSMSLMDTQINHIILGVVVSIVVSIIAGIVPSSKAAKLDPIESLRHE